MSGPSDHSPGMDEDERRAVALLREARARDRAPEHLRARIQAMRAERPSARRRWSGRGAGWPAAAATALAAVIVALVLGLPGGSPGAPSVARAAAVALTGPTLPAPARDPRDAYRLRAHVDGLAFPTWADEGLRASGLRRGRLAGHAIITVLYRARRLRVTYSIVSAPALPQPNGQATRFGRFIFHVFAVKGRSAVTWRARGHTCLLSAAPGVPAGALERLAGRGA